MSLIDLFISYIAGTFANTAQVRREATAGNPVHPQARHVIGVVNHKIANLPDNFDGYFVIEESYFTLPDREVHKHYLFSYVPLDTERIVLTSYNVPSDIPPESFTNDNPDISLNYDQLEVSPRFQPLVINYVDGEFVGKNISAFGPDTLFRFGMRITPSAMFITELLEKDGERIAGYDTPIEYVRIMSH